MQCIYCEISERQYNSLRNNEVEIYDYLEYIGKYIKKDNYLFLDKTWDLIYFILTGKSLFESDENAELPLIFGSNTIASFDENKDKIGPVRYITNDDAKSCIQLFKGIDKEVYVEKFNFNNILEHNVYFDKNLSAEEALDISFESFEALKGFFERVASNNNFLIVYFD